MPYFTAVVNSARYWPNPPSPATAITFRRPATAAQAPIAAGKPKPIDPRYPDINTSWPGRHSK